ncbi:MAG: hypothetical protein K0R00_156 [Herbinix sp.]|jgi:chemotaxis protein histidine kinase CheA|nr:hypothetical protein [Herbinix sp.]
MERRNSFYEDIIGGGDFYSEKTASNNTEVIESMIDTFSTDEMEILAQELNIAYEKKASVNTQTIEEKIAEDTQEEREADKEDLAVQNAEKADGEPVEDERDATGSEEAEEAKTKAEKEEIVNPEAKELEEKVTTAAEYSEEELTKIAYEVAEEKLASEGYSLTDYVFSYLPDEKVASFIADKAEKLAFLSERSPLQVADDILLNIGDLVDAKGE